MPLARKVGRVSVLLKELGDRGRFLTQTVLVAGSDDDRQRRADWNAPGDERSTASGAAGLTIPVSKDRAFLGDPVDIGRRMAERGTAQGIGAKVVPPSVVGHQHDDVGPLLL